MVSTIFLGDIAFSTKIMQQVSAISNPWDNLLLDSDFLIGNFEFPYSENRNPYFDTSYLGHLAPEESLQLLAVSPVNYYSIANNHIMDWGVEGLLKTKKFLQSLGAQVFGAGVNQEESSKPLIIDHDGIRIGFLAYCKKGNFSATKSSAGAAMLDKNNVYEDVASLNAIVDHVIVNLHWGVEYSDYPYPPDIKIAHSIIDAGASAIMGHHPHVVQGLEVYRGCPIFYSLGSFIYDLWSERVYIEKNF